MEMPHDQYCQLRMLEYMKDNDFQAASNYAEMWGNRLKEEEKQNETVRPSRAV